MTAGEYTAVAANLAHEGHGAESRASSAAPAAKSASAASSAADAFKAAKAAKADLAPPQVAKTGLPAAGPSKAGANFAAASAAMECARQLAVHGGGQPVHRTSGGQSPQATDLSTAMPWILIQSNTVDGSQIVVEAAAAAATAAAAVARAAALARQQVTALSPTSSPLTVTLNQCCQHPALHSPHCLAIAMRHILALD